VNDVEKDLHLTLSYLTDQDDRRDWHSPFLWARSYDFGSDLFANFAGDSIHNRKRIFRLTATVAQLLEVGVKNSVGYRGN
jgi:hypothetical protein